MKYFNIAVVTFNYLCRTNSVINNVYLCEHTYSCIKNF